jgi:hypothetical protein
VARRQLAELLRVPLRDVRALLLDPVDLRGLPFLGSDGRSKWATPEFLPQDGSGILFLDELNAAPRMVQASCYQLVLDRKLGEYTLPEGWAIIAAGNRDSDRAVTTRMPTPLRNRFVHLEFDVDLQDWSEWAIQAGIRPEVIAFLRFRPELLSAPHREAHAFPSPRSWEFVSCILDSLDSQSNPTIEHEVIAGAIGTGAATELSVFHRMFRELPNIDAILLNPLQEPVPENAAAQYAVASDLARCASDTNFDRICLYLVFCGDNGKPRWQETILTDHIKPAAVQAGIGLVGWHTFRHYSGLRTMPGKMEFSSVIGLVR